MTGEATAASAAAVVAAAREAGVAVACAESLTGGAVASAIVAVPGASEVFLGGAVTYATEMKAQVLGVDPALLVDPGPVSAEVAIAMAAGARRLTGADVAVSTTGVAGPDPHAGHEPGEYVIGVSSAEGDSASWHRASGGRDDVRAAAVASALDAALAAILPKAKRPRDLNGT